VRNSQLPGQLYKDFTFVRQFPSLFSFFVGYCQLCLSKISEQTDYNWPFTQRLTKVLTFS